MSNVEENNTLEDIKKNITTYMKGVRSEWGKITWPQKEQVKIDTWIVLIVVTLITLFVFVVDKAFMWLFNDGLKLLLQNFTGF